MNYIAKKGYVHRDLAARNVLMYLPETYIQYQDLEILEHLNVPIGSVQTTFYGPFISEMGHILPIKVRYKSWLLNLKSKN